MKTFTAALIQFQVADDPEANLRRIEEGLREAAARGAKLVCGPELFLCPCTPESISSHAAAIPGALTGRLAELARRYSVYFVPGSIPERREGGKPYNTLVAFGPDGSLIGTYRKRHLFRVEFRGSFAHDERDYLSPGSEPAPIIETPLARIGTSICYDLRFPEQTLRLALDGAEIIVAPSAFTKLTGQAHWHILCRARAIETGCFLLAPDQAGTPPGGPARYGRSTIVGPWGDVLAVAGDGDEVITAELPAESLAEARARMRSLADRVRGDSVPEP